MIAHLERTGDLEKIGDAQADGKERIRQLVSTFEITVANASHHARLVAEEAHRRRVLNLLDEARPHALNGGVSDALREQLDEALRMTGTTSTRSRPSPVFKTLDEFTPARGSLALLGGPTPASSGVREGADRQALAPPPLRFGSRSPAVMGRDGVEGGHPSARLDGRDVRAWRCGRLPGREGLEGGPVASPEGVYGEETANVRETDA